MERITQLLKLNEDPTGAACGLDGDVAREVGAAVRDIVDAGKGDELLALLNPLVQGKEGGDALFFAAARAQALAGSPEMASGLYLGLCERMEQRGEWAELLPALELAVEECGTPALARLAARAWEKNGVDFAPIPLLRRARELAGDDPRVKWALGNALLEEGDAEGRALVAESLPHFARKKEYARVEEGMLNLAEGIGRNELRKLLDAIGQLLKADEVDRVMTIFELSRDAFIEHGLSGEAWTMLRKFLEKSTNNNALRAVAAKFGPGAYPDVLNAKKMFERAGIGDKEIALEEALAVLDKLLELPAGKYVFHHSWGVGQITDNDGENLIIRFKEKPGHRMSLKLALDALMFLAPTDLRVKMYIDRDAVLRGVREEPAELFFHVLEHVGGEAKQDEIRKQLLHLGILTSSTWADWWKRARKAAEKDPRFDLSHTFRKVYRLRSEGEAPVTVPEISLESNFRKGLSLLFKFLDQHAGGAPDVSRRYGDAVQEQANREETAPADRMLGHVLLHQVGRPDEDGIARAIDAMAATLDMGTLSAEQQKTVIGIVPERCLAKAGRLMLTSRVVTVRREAWQALQRLPAEERARVVSEVLEKSPHGGSGVLHLVREFLASEPERVIDLLHSLLYILEEPEKENQRSDALKIVGSDRFRAALAKHEPKEGEWDFLRSRLSHWKHSERYLLPVLESLADTQFAAMADEVEEHRSAGRPRVETSVLDHFDGRILMTRGTLNRLQKEVEGLDWDLKTTIPHMIRKARELGDLSENAEYDAAKNRQREATKRLEELYERIRLARAIEDLEFDAEKIGPGAEVILTAGGGGRHRFWVLGEGDLDIGENVVSYRAPLGMSLLGKKPGDQVSLPDGETLTVESFTCKLPGEADGD